MDNEETIGHLSLGGEHSILVKMGTYRGQTRFDIRKYYRDFSGEGSTGDYEAHMEVVKRGDVSEIGLKPTKKGISLSMNDFMTLMEESLVPAYEAWVKSKGKVEKENGSKD